MSTNTPPDRPERPADDPAPPARGVGEGRDVARSGLAEAGILEDDTPQRWLNQDREWAQHELSRELDQYVGDPDGARAWAAELFGVPEAELQSLTVRAVESRTASRIAGMPIRRHIVHFGDIAEYLNVRRQLGGGSASRGVTLHLETQNGPTPLILATGPVGDDPLPDLPPGSVMDPTVVAGPEHELRHTIDPNIDLRTGCDWLLGEAFTYYDQDIEHPRGTYMNEDNRWRFYAASLDIDSHYRACTDGVENPPTREEFSALCTALAGAVRALRERVGHLEAQRTLARSMAISQIFEAAGIPPPAIPGTPG